MTAPTATFGERVVLAAPTGADAFNLRSILREAGLHADACPDIGALAAEIERGCGAALLTAEALSHPRHVDLAAVIERQPPWSDLPLILVVNGGRSGTAGAEAARRLGARGNITLVERPLHRATLLSTLHAALRARRRQYEVHALLRERDDLLASLEQRVADRTARLADLNAELEAFSYSVSHDLRAPLRALEGYARALSEDFASALPAEARTYVERIAKNAGQMDRLTRDVLALSQLSRNELPLEEVDLDVLFPQIIDQYPDLGEAARRIALHPPLGRVRAHPSSLAQCISNLLQNALKFVPADRVPAVTVHSATAFGRVIVSIQDNGIGIAHPHQERIFGIFERVGTADIPGTGIGLAIAKKAVERMGGTIGVESTVGEGARFWFELTEAPSNAAQEPPPPTITKAPPT